MLQGEILSAQGQHGQAVISIEDGIARGETFQAHESLAWAYEQMGDTKAAIAENEWLLQNRGRAIVECSEERCQIASVTDWALAHYRLGRLQEQSSQRQEAASSYRRFLAHWLDAGGLAVREDAERRLEALDAKRSEVEP